MPEKMSLEARVEELSREVRLLRQRVDELSAGVPPSVATAARQPPHDLRDRELTGETSEDLIHWVRQSSLLQKISALCFLLVVALILRTLTDNGLLDTSIGSGIGMLYAGGLIGVGWALYRRSSPLAAVLAVSGAVLMFTVAVEASARFESLPAGAAYAIIILTGAAMALISYFYRSGLPILVGTFGMGIAGVAIEYPHPSYPSLVVLLFVANGLGFVASRLQRCSWLRWTLFLVTAVLFQVWGYKLGLTLSGEAHPANDMAQAWFLPVIAVFFAGYLGAVLFGILWPRDGRVARFDLLLPVVLAFWAYSAAHYVVQPRWGTSFWLGTLGLFAAIGHLGLAIWLGTRRENPVAAPSFLVAAAVLLALSISSLAGTLLPALPLISALAIAAVGLSRKWESGPARIVSYLLQFYCCFEIVRWFFADPLARAGDPGALLVAMLLAALAGYHYFWSLSHPPPEQSDFFTKFDEGNRLCVFLLLAALVNGFFLVRGAMGVLLPVLNGEGVAGFRAGQSVIINLGAAAVMIWALFRNDQEIRNLAILITLIGGGKVFFLDLFGVQAMGIKGFPLVLSVFSFGTAIAIESLVLGRWQKRTEGTSGRREEFESDKKEVPSHQ